MPDITLSLPQRAYDGLVEAATRNSLSLATLAGDALKLQGLQYANLFQIGVVTSGAIIARFTPEEYTAILNASKTDPAIADLIAELTGEGHIVIDDPRLVNGLQKLVDVGLLKSDRPSQIMAYQHPTPA